MMNFVLTILWEKLKIIKKNALVFKGNRNYNGLNLLKEWLINKKYTNGDIKRFIFKKS